MGLNIFLSYASKDAPYFKIPVIAEKLMQYPEIDDVFYWHEDAREDIIKYMNETISKCEVFILFCSPRALTSEPVQIEWGVALKNKKVVIPIFFNEEHIPTLLSTLVGLHYDPYYCEDLDEMIKELYFLVLKRTNLKKISVSDESLVDENQHGTFRLIMKILMNMEVVSGVALINSVGSIVSSLLDENLNEAKVAAIGATILSVSERTCEELGHGKLNLTYIDGESGRVLISRISTDNIILIIFNTFSTNQEIFNEYFKIFNLLKKGISNIPLE
jgi:predicted regulator of Ras-like GTPase activity (Roadblock/LC7/MglB family)